LVVRLRHSKASAASALALVPVLQGFQEAPPVLTAGKNGLAPVAAIQDTADRPRIRSAYCGMQNSEFRMRKADSVGGTPTEATGKLEQQQAGPLSGLVALPGNALMIGEEKGLHDA
jgi:hypothetical protein